MPCNSDYLNATPQEKWVQRTAKLYVYAASKMGLKKDIPAFILEQSNNQYARDPNDVIVPALCDLISNMTPVQREAIVYDAREKMSRKLADWWEAHQEADRIREQNENDEKAAQELRVSALSKLTEEEKKALGL